MKLFREEDRLKEDRGVLLINDPAELSLWNAREELGIDAIAFDYPVRNALRDLTTIFADTIGFKNFKFNIGEHGRIDERLSDELPPFLEADYNKIMHDMCAMLWQAGETQIRQVQLRTNTYHHDYWEAHGTAIILPLIGLSTLFRNEAGEEYALGNKLVIFDKEHRAPRREDNIGSRAYFGAFFERSNLVELV